MPKIITTYLHKNWLWKSPHVLVHDSEDPAKAEAFNRMKWERVETSSNIILFFSKTNLLKTDILIMKDGLECGEKLFNSLSN